MDDSEMVTELRRKAESKAMTRMLLEDAGVSLVPAGFSSMFPNLEQDLRDADELEYGALALSADLIEGTYTGDPVDPAKLAAVLRKSAEKEDDFAWRQDSEAEDKEFDEEHGGDEDDDEDDDGGESAEEMREYAESARETAKFYREVADRLEADKK
jgi:hypothetical protein